MVLRLLGLLLLVAAARADDWWVVVPRKEGAPLRIHASGKIIDPAKVPVRGNARLSPDGKRWLYAEWREKNRDVFACDLDGKNETRLTRHRAMDAGASWAPDGKRILFHSQRVGNWQVWLREADGSLKMLTRDEHGAWVPRFSPDGKRVAFLSRVPHRGKGWMADLVVLDLATKKRTKLLEKSVMPNYSWSPNGKTIAISGLGWLKLIDVESAKVTKAFVFKEIDKRLHAHSANNILWHPEGKQLALAIQFYGSRAAAMRNNPMGGPAAGEFKPLPGDREIFFLSLDGTLKEVKLPDGAITRPLRWVSVR